MTYRQFKYNKDKNLFYEEAKEKAIEKIVKSKKLIQGNEESEEEEEQESSEPESTTNENNSKKSADSTKFIRENQLFLKLKNEEKNNNKEIKENSFTKERSYSNKKMASNKKLGNDIFEQNNLNKIEEKPKKNEEDFYHVNLNKISYYVFNFSTGFPEQQKNQYYKMSHVTYLMKTEQEKMKNSNSLFLHNTKFMKGKKKGNVIKKEEENEIINNNSPSLQLKEIYRELSSKKMEPSIIKMFLYSIIIFILIIATGILNIIISSYIKTSIYSIFILIQNSEYLYKNILFQTTIIKEMLILRNPYYTNTINPNKTLYYKDLSKRVYQYFTENTFIISNLTKYFNALSKKDEESITQKVDEIKIVDPLKRTNSYYQSKFYKILLYSAYRELNSVLYHISQIPMEKIFHYHQDVYYSLYNGNSHLFINTEKQLERLNEKMDEKIKLGHNIIIICCVVIFLIFCGCNFIFSYFYKKITENKNKYLSVLIGLDKNLIISSLQKCDKLLQKLKENENIKKRKISLDSSSLSYSEIENDNFKFIIENKDKEVKTLKQIMNQIENKTKLKKSIIFQLILFLIFLAWQIGIYIYYYHKITIYGYISSYGYYISLFASNFIFPFTSVREYQSGKKIKYYNTTIDLYINNTFQNYYLIYSQAAKIKDGYRIYFPESYQDFLNNLYNSKIYEFINDYNNDYPNQKINSTNFLFGTPRFGFFTMLTSFVEELRMLKGKIENYYEFADKKNFKYNESVENDPYHIYESMYSQYEDHMEEYKKYNPINILKTNSHKHLLITYLYINTQVFNSLVEKSVKLYEQLFDKYNFLNLILNILFISFITLGYFFIWLPFLLFLNKNIDKIKKIIYIIPSELLINIADINSLLDTV